MAAPGLTIAVAAGIGENHAELGTDAAEIAEVLRQVLNPDGVLVLMDLGSAVLSAQAALELLEPEEQKGIRLSPAPFVEGAVIAAVQSSAGSNLDQVLGELERALAAKREQVEPAQSVTSIAAAVATAQDCAYSETVLEVANEHGLHARPAAELVALAGKFPDEIEITNMRSGAGPATARSLTSLALLQVGRGDSIRVRAYGARREAALSAVVEFAKAGFGENGNHQGASEPRNQRGVPVSPGIAIAPLLYVKPFTPMLYSEALGSPQEEQSKLREAIARAKKRFAQRAPGNAEAAAIQDAERAVLDDPVLLRKAEALVADGQSAFAAWRKVADEIAGSYQAMNDEYLRGRAADIRDVEQMVLRELSGCGAFDFASVTQPSIVFTHELLPSEAAGCQHSQVLGVIAQRGSPTSHAAILLRSAGIPMVIGVDWIDANNDGKPAAIDGITGEVWIDPANDVVLELGKRQQQQTHLQQQALAAVGEPTITRDGVLVEVMANVSSATDAEVAARNCATGIGLLRTELLLSSLRVASEEEQVSAIQQALGAMPGPLVVRTLDIGGDKPWSALPCEPEANPFLGVRGLRLTLRNPSFFRQHLRAILRSGAGRNLWIMFPMVSTEKEIVQARDLVADVHAELAERGIPHAWPVKLGCMIEVPSAALLADAFTGVVDFFSIGTNDLTQYTLAAERGNASLSDLQDALHPAVLRLIDQVVQAADVMSRHASICGEAAADPLSAAVFLGLGVRSLSVAPTLVPQTKAWIRNLAVAELTPMAKQALQCSDAAEVRNLFSRLLAVCGDHAGPV